MDTLSGLPHVFTESGQQEAVFYTAFAALVGVTVTLILIHKVKHSVPTPTPEIPAPFGYGLTGLPVAFHDLSEEALDQTGETFDLPIWATNNTCGGCFKAFVKDGFLCPTCSDIAGRPRVHEVFRMLEAGDEGRAWFMAESLMKDVVAFRSHAAAN